MERELEILQKKVNSTLTEKAQDITEVITRIQKTGAFLDDYLPPVKALEFTQPTEDRPNIEMTFAIEDERFASRVHPHAVGQLGDKLGIPPGFLRKMWTGNSWERESATNLINDFTANAARERLLVRTYDGQVRGVMSDKYRRLNTFKIFLAFLQAVQATGSKIVRAHSGDTQNHLEVIHPNIVHFDTPKNGKNYAIFGSGIRSSDFGDGALELRSFMMNVVCMNGMVGKSVLREVHLGGRIPENLVVSEMTMLKDTEATASLIKDATRQLYNPENQLSLIGKIQDASNASVDLEQEVKRLPKLGVQKSEVEALEKILMNNNPADGVVGEPTTWKFVNGLTAVARESEPERQRELEKIAGEMVGI